MCGCHVDCLRGLHMVSSSRIPSLAIYMVPPINKLMIQTELWLTPLILLPGVALLIMSTSARFWQIHEEFHRLLERPDDHAKIVSRQLLRRGILFRNALLCLYASVGLFSIGSLLGGFINLWMPRLLWLVGGVTLIGIAALVFASVQLIRESLVCMNVITDSSRQIESYTSHEGSAGNIR